MVNAAIGTLLILAILGLGIILAFFIACCQCSRPIHPVHCMVYVRKIDDLASIEPEVNSALAAKDATLVNLEIRPYCRNDYNAVLVTALYRKKYHA